jgi:hypothetical protein
MICILVFAGMAAMIGERFFKIGLHLWSQLY